MAYVKIAGALTARHTCSSFQDPTEKPTGQEGHTYVGIDRQTNNGDSQNWQKTMQKNHKQSTSLQSPGSPLDPSEMGLPRPSKNSLRNMQKHR